MGQCFLDYAGLKQFWKVVRDNTVPMRGKALGTNSTAIGEGSYAGILNEDDSDKSTYRYVAWQWVPTEEFTVSATASTSMPIGNYYGFPLPKNGKVQWSIGGGQTTKYTNTSTGNELLVVIKAVKKVNDATFIFYGDTTAPYNISKTLIAGKHIMTPFGEYLKSVTKLTINNEVYYQVIIYNPSSFQSYYDFTQPVEVMCATKYNNIAVRGDYSFVSGYNSAAGGTCSFVSGRQSIGGSYSFASGAYSVASNSYSVAIGCGSVASGSYSTAIGEGSMVNGNYSTSLAQRGIVNNDYQTVVGRYNDPIEGFFVVGDGTNSNNRSNALVIDKNGNVNGGSSKWSITKNGTATFSNLVIDNDDITGGNGNNYVLLAGGGLKPVSDFGSGSGSGSGGTISSLSNSLTIKINGTSKSFNGSTPVTVDITPANIGAATASHTHDDYALVNHTHSDYLPLTGGTLTGDLTTNGTLTATTIRKKGSSDDFVLLAGGGTKRLSEIGSGSGSVSGDYLPLTGGTMTGDIIMSSSMQQQGLRDNSIGLIGFVKRVAIDVDSNGSPIYFTGIALQPESGAGVYINRDTFTYRGNNIIHSGNIGDYYTSIPVVTTTTNGLMSSDMFKAKMVKSVGVRQGLPYVSDDGTITNHSVYITQKKDNITDYYSSGLVMQDTVDVKIPNATKDYDGSMSYTDKRKLDNMIAILNQNIQISDLFGDTAQKSPSIPDFDHTNPPSLLRINFKDTAFVCTLCSTDYTNTATYHNSHNNYTVIVRNTSVTITK